MTATAADLFDLLPNEILEIILLEQLCLDFPTHSPRQMRMDPLHACRAVMVCWRWRDIIMDYFRRVPWISVGKVLSDPPATIETHSWIPTDIQMMANANHGRVEPILDLMARTAGHDCPFSFQPESFSAVIPLRGAIMAYVGENTFEPLFLHDMAAQHLPLCLETFYEEFYWTHRMDTIRNHILYAIAHPKHIVPMLKTIAKRGDIESLKVATRLGSAESTQIPQLVEKMWGSLFHIALLHDQMQLAIWMANPDESPHPIPAKAYTDEYFLKSLILQGSTQAIDFYYRYKWNKCLPPSLLDGTLDFGVGWNAYVTQCALRRKSPRITRYLMRTFLGYGDYPPPQNLELHMALSFTLAPLDDFPKLLRAAIHGAHIRVESSLPREVEILKRVIITLSVPRAEMAFDLITVPNEWRAELMVHTLKLWSVPMADLVHKRLEAPPLDRDEVSLPLLDIVLDAHSATQGIEMLKWTVKHYPNIRARNVTIHIHDPDDTEMEHVTTVMHYSHLIPLVLCMGISVADMDLVMRRYRLENGTIDDDDHHHHENKVEYEDYPFPLSPPKARAETIGRWCIVTNNVPMLDMLWTKHQLPVSGIDTGTRSMLRADREIIAYICAQRYKTGVGCIRLDTVKWLKEHMPADAFKQFSIDYKESFDDQALFYVSSSSS
jgi:hypothetical protein